MCGVLRSRWADVIDDTRTAWHGRTGVCVGRENGRTSRGRREQTRGPPSLLSLQHLRPPIPSSPSSVYFCRGNREGERHDTDGVLICLE